MGRSGSNTEGAAKRRPTAAQVARLVRKCLDEGASVEIDGLGSFERDAAGELRFLAFTRPKIFIAYVEEDLAIALRLCQALKEADCDPWLDKERLLPGQNWPRSIEGAIDVADYFAALFSRRSVTKRGHFQSELRYAMDCAVRQPLEHAFFLPVRVDNCRIPGGITNSIQHVDLFPDWEKGMRKLVRAIRRKRSWRE